jgi:glycine betaine/choline ABC-type transport system substrate-binding protein
MTVVNNGQTISMTTFVKHNEISVHYTAGNISRSFEFEAVPGGNIHIYLKYVGAKMSIVNQ